MTSSNTASVRTCAHNKYCINHFSNKGNQSPLETRQSGMAHFTPSSQPATRYAASHASLSRHTPAAEKSIHARLLWYPPTTHASYAPLCENMFSTKREVLNVLHSHQRRIELQLKCTENLVKFGHVVFELCEHTNDCNTLHRYWEYWGGGSNEPNIWLT